MPPQPNIPQKDHPNETSVGVASEGQFVFIESEEFNENSSGSDTGVDIENETEYAGYKLLQQDDGNSQTVDDANDSGSEESSFSDEDDCNDSVNKTVGIAFTKGASDAEVDINYKDLVCSGIDDNTFPGRLSNESCAQLGDNEFEADFTLQENKDEMEMTSEHVEQVKNAMTGFTLPPMNIPDWAKTISEEDWKKSLIRSVQKKK